MTRQWTEEKIAALVDGSLEGQEAEIYRQILEADPEARAYAEQIRRSNAMLREAFEIPDGEPMPAPIAAAIYGEPDKITVLDKRRALGRWMPPAIAASGALIAGLGIGSAFLDGPEQAIATLGETPTGGPLHTALETLASGTTSDAGVRPFLTFRDGAGRPCREFELATGDTIASEFGIACRSAVGQWQIEALVAAPRAGTGGERYRPASGEGVDLLAPVLETLEAGAAMAPDAEAALLARGWRD